MDNSHDGTERPCDSNTIFLLSFNAFSKFKSFNLSQEFLKLSVQLIPLSPFLTS